MHVRTLSHMRAWGLSMYAGIRKIQPLLKVKGKNSNNNTMIMGGEILLAKFVLLPYWIAFL